MGETRDLGHRVELVPMDAHFNGISVALYYMDGDAGPGYLVHSYSGLEGVQDRITFLKQAVCCLGGLKEGTDGLLRFMCGDEHISGIKRVFLEACKLPSDSVLDAMPLAVTDKKSGLEIHVVGEGEGVYTVTARGESKDRDRRVTLISGGLMKLAAMEEIPGRLDQVRFTCGHVHDPMVGLLLVRAPNVRAALREQEMTASRGVLAAPSQQE